MIQVGNGHENGVESKGSNHQTRESNDMIYTALFQPHPI